MTQDYTTEDAEADEPVVSAGYRSYEVYQRERVGETTNLVNPRDLIAPQYLGDPFTVPAVLREHYPCFRDWVGNRFWLTRYDDVTSVFVDDANFETRPKSAVYASTVDGRDLGRHPEVRQAWVQSHDAVIDDVIAQVLDAVSGTCDVATEVADELEARLFERVVGLGGSAKVARSLLHRMSAGTSWDERARIDGLTAFGELRQLLAAQLTERLQQPADDLLTVFANLGASADDVVITLLEIDRATLPASIANLWCLLLTHAEQFAVVQAEPRLMKFAYLESLRHAPAIPTADRFARHEVERFGRLLPQGALVHLSAAAANRDPRQFNEPDRFDVGRKDLCRREPRGQYRADGLPAAIAFGHGKPSRLPAVPRDAPRSAYAVTRDMAVALSLGLLERFPGIECVAESEPSMSLNYLGGTYRCRTLPVRLSS